MSWPCFTSCVVVGDCRSTGKPRSSRSARRTWYCWRFRCNGLSRIYRSCWRARSSWGFRPARSCRSAGSERSSWFYGTHRLVYTELCLLRSVHLTVCCWHIYRCLLCRVGAVLANLTRDPVCVANLFICVMHHVLEKNKPTFIFAKPVDQM